MMTDEDRALQVGFRVRGQVQGVGFRWWARRAATSLGLHGVVLNRMDGSVEVHAGGERESVELFEAHLAEGPQGASVDGVERFPSNRPLPREFEIISELGIF